MKEEISLEEMTVLFLLDQVEFPFKQYNDFDMYNAVVQHQGKQVYYQYQIDHWTYSHIIKDESKQNGKI